MSIIKDLFSLSTQQDFKSGGDGIKQFNWYAVNTAAVSAADANVTSAGLATFVCNTTNSGTTVSGYTVPFIYQLITGDFAIETKVSDNGDATYEGCGLFLSHVSNDALHMFFLRYFSGVPGTSVACRSREGTDLTIGLDILNSSWVNFRVTRVGNLFSFYRKVNTGDTWTLHGQASRSDLGDTIKVGLFAQTGNATGSYTAQFDFFVGGIDIVRNSKSSSATQGNLDGSYCNNILTSIVEKVDGIESYSQKIAVRNFLDPANVLVSFTNDSFALAPDDSGHPGVFGAFGASLLLSAVADVNSCFWVKCRGRSTDTLGFITDTLTIQNQTTLSTISVPLRGRSTFPVTVLGTAGNYYIGIDLGGNYWLHNSSGGAGDIDVWDTTGGTYLNVTYAGYSVVGNNTIFDQKVLADGFTLDTVMTNPAPGIYKVSHTFQSTTERWLRLEKYLRGSAATSATTSSVVAYSTSGTKQLDAVHFQGTCMHYAPNVNVITGLIPGNGYDNDWCLFQWDYVANTSWYNTLISYAENSAGASRQMIRYGYLKNGSTTDYTMHVPAGIAVEYSYVIFCNVVESQATFNEVLYSSYHDAYATGSSYSDVEKMLWTTSHQLKRLKRHILVEGAKELVIAPSSVYSAMISAGDMIFAAFGLAETTTMNLVSDLLHRLGPQDGLSASGSVAGSAGNTLDGTYALYVPFVELYSKEFLGYIPGGEALQIYAEVADSYVDAISNQKLLPDTSTRLAHYYSDVFAGPESAGYGNFENSFSFTQDTTTQYRWTVNSNSTSATRVGVDSGVTPYEGSYMAKIPVTGGSGKYSGLDSMKIAVPASKTFTASVALNIPTPFVSGGFKLRIREFTSSLVAGTVSDSALVTTTTGWETTTLTTTIAAGTNYIKLCLESDESGTAYCDAAQITLDNPDVGYDGLLWNCSIMPPQIQGNTLSPSLFAAVWSQINMRSLKRLLGNQWTAAHEATLVLIEGSFPNAFWLDANHNTIVDDVYHNYRKSWISSWSLFSHWMWYTITGEKIFTDQQIIDITTAYPKSSCNTNLGSYAYKGWVTKLDGSSVSGAEYTATWLPNWPYTSGYYVNAGAWLWASDTFFHKSRAIADINHAVEEFYRRLDIEVATDYNSHESVNSVTGAVTASSKGYGTNVISLVSIIRLFFDNLSANSVDLIWRSYYGTDFLEYNLCRSLTIPVLATDVVYSTSDISQLTHTDAPLSPNQGYYYSMFVKKLDGSFLKSNEIFVITGTIFSVGRSFGNIVW